MGLGAGGVILACFAMLTGCDRPGAREQVGDIRGEPIRPAPAVSTSAAVSISISAPAAITHPSLLSGVTNSPAVAASAAGGAAGSDGKKGQEFTVVGFEKLSGYPFEAPDDLLAPPSNQVAQATARTEAQIPKEIKALDRRRVSLQGFMLPLKVENGSVTEFLIMKDQSMCCFGAVPKINEWVSVKMTGTGVKPFMDRPVTFYGTLHVGEMRENGYLVGIYSMDGEKMSEPTDR